MADVQKELQKLKALINQRPTTAIFSNKSNESDKISNGDAEFFINDMSKKFVFTRAGIKNPVMVDPNTKTLENVEYINDVHIKEITEQVQSIEELKEAVNRHDECIEIINAKNVEQDSKISNCELKNAEQDSKISNCETRIQNINAKDTEQDSKISNCETSMQNINIDIVNIKAENNTQNSRITNCEDKNTKQDQRLSNCEFKDSALEQRIIDLENNVVAGPEEIITEFRVGAKQINSRESEWGSGYGLLNIAFFTDGLYNNDLYGKTIWIQASYMLADDNKFGNRGPYNYEITYTVPRTINVNEQIEIAKNVYFRRTWNDCYGFQWHYVPFSGSDTGATVSKAIIYEYKPGHTHHFIRGDLRTTGKLSVDNGLTVGGGFVANAVSNYINGNIIISGGCITNNIRSPDGSPNLRFATSANSAFMTFVESDNTLHIYRPINMHGNSITGNSQTITHITNVDEDIELGTFCEANGNIYDGYGKIGNIDCICQVKQATLLNKRIVGIITNKDEFASHGDVLVKVVDDTYEIGDILAPDENGYGRKATEDELIFMMMYAIPRPKITALNVEGYGGFVACFIV